MFVWNRTEALMTLSLEYYLRARALLLRNHVRLQSKQVRIPEDMQQKSGMLQRPTTQYYIYVHKDDLEQAQQLIEQMGPELDPMEGALSW